MKVAKYYRLLNKHKSGKQQGQFDLNGQKETLRERVVVSQEWIDQVNAQSETSGLLYEVDEKATAERNRKTGEKESGTTGAPAADAAPTESAEDKAKREEKEATTNWGTAAAEGFVVGDATSNELKAFAAKHSIELTEKANYEGRTEKQQLVVDVTKWLDLAKQ